MSESPVELSVTPFNAVFRVKFAISSTILSKKPNDMSWNKAMYYAKSGLVDAFRVQWRLVRRIPRTLAAEFIRW